jgi:hypothetical protein
VRHDDDFLAKIRAYTPQAYPRQSRGSVRRERVPRTVPFSDPARLRSRSCIINGEAVAYEDTGIAASSN